MQRTSRKREIVVRLTAVAVIAGLVGAVIVVTKKQPSASMVGATTSNAASSKSAQTTSTTSGSTAKNNSYKNGTFVASGSYDSPGGTESITVSVTLQNGVVTATSAQSGATDEDAKEFQAQFISGYKQLVIGKSISNLSLSRVSGSSLTSQGFNEAIDQIKQEAQTS
jgi:hypothetical protein